MAVTFRLDPKSRRALDALAKRKRLSRSEVVRDALAVYGAGQESPDAGPYEAWLDVIGAVSLGARDAARTTGDQFAAQVRDRRARRAR